MMHEKEPWEVTPAEEEATIKMNPSEEVLEQKEETEETAEKKAAPKTPVWAIVVIVVLALALIATAAFAFFRLNPPAQKTETLESHHINALGNPSWSIHYTISEDGAVDHYYYIDELGEVSVSEADMTALADQVIATCEDITLDNRTFQYYYLESLNTFYYTQYYNNVSYVDMSYPMDAQMDTYFSNGTTTWQQSFLETSMTDFSATAAINMEAKKNGFTLSDAQKQEIAAMQELQTAAMYYGYEDALQFLKAMYGPLATIDSYNQYIEDSMIDSYYTEELSKTVVIEEDEYSAYYDANATEYANLNVLKDNQPLSMDVRHILIQPEASEDGTISDEAWTAAEQEAQRILDEWTAGDATEDSFAELATTYTTDPGSAQTGGLYEGVIRGQMVTEFNDWCFDPARVVGDTGIVKTSYGYHIMYYSAAGEELYWHSIVKEDILQEKVIELRQQILEQYTFTTDYANVIVMDMTTPVTTTETTVPVG